MAESNYIGFYEYKGFTIWNSTGKTWIAEPNWSIEAIENYKASAISHRAIVEAKKWIRNIGQFLKEKDFLNQD